jgi:hypothetical protein
VNPESEGCWPGQRHSFVRVTSKDGLCPPGNLLAKIAGLAAARRREETSTFTSTGSVARDGSTGRWAIDDLGWPDVIAAFVLIHDGRPRIAGVVARRVRRRAPARSRPPGSGGQGVTDD